MALGTVNLHIKSVEKEAGVPFDEAGFITSAVSNAGNNVTTTVVPRTDSSGKVVYDVIIVDIELA